MKKRSVQFIFLILLILKHGMAQETYASDTTLISANQISYDKEKVIAQGHVVLTYDKTQIETALLIYDPATGLIESQGEAVLVQDGERMVGKDLRYNVMTRQGSLSSISGSTKNVYAEGQPIRGELYFSGKVIEINDNILLFKEVNASTCDYPWGKKHYHISAEEIKVIPGDKMVISNGRLWLGNTPLWRVAKLVIDLHPVVTHRQSYAPHFGYNKVDGFFIKTNTNYTAYKDNYGSVLLDYYQKTGLASGVEHQFPIATKGSGHLSLYRQNGRGFQKFTREQVSTSGQYDFGGGLKANGNINIFRYRVPPVISPDSYSTQATVSKQGGRYSWNLTESNNVTSGFLNSQSIQYRHYQDFGDNFHLELSESYYKSSRGLTTNSTFHNLTAFSKQFNGWSASLFYEKTDAGLFGGGFINRTPEIALRTDNLSFKEFKLPYQLSMSFGNYFESFRNIHASRWDFQVNVPQHRIDFWKNFHLTTSGLFRQDFYDTGRFYATRNNHARYVLGNQTQLATSLGKHFDAVMDYRSQSHIGFDPLIYDIVPPFRTLSGEISFYNKDVWRVNVGTAYDYKNRFYHQLVTRLDLHPVKNWWLHMDGHYDPNSKKWQNLIAVADVSPFKDIRVQYWSSFSLLNGQVGYQDIAVTKNWHDWETRVIYRWHSQEVFLFFNLKAFPEQQVQLGINPLLDLDATKAQFEVH